MRFTLLASGRIDDAVSPFRRVSGMPIESHPKWPGWSQQKTLLLQIDPEAWPAPSTPVLLDGHHFVPKPELHVTLVGRALGQQVLASLGERRYRTLVVRTAYEALDWSFERSGVMLRLEKHGAEGGPDDRMGAIIERVELPALADFYRQLGLLLGREIAVPPPHVTLYTAGKAKGIGIPNANALREFTLRAVEPAELVADPTRVTASPRALA